MAKFTRQNFIPRKSPGAIPGFGFSRPLEAIYSQTSKKIHLICENHLQGEPFIYLKVSTIFFLKNLQSFDVSQKEKVVRIYLSAEAANMFIEVRGKGKVDFKTFRIM